MNTKICACCKVEKKFEEFQSRKKSKFGIGSYCLECWRIKAKKFREENPEKRKKISLKYSRSEKGKQKKMEYEQKNLDRVLQTRKQWREKNSEMLKEYMSEYRKNNSEKVRERIKAWEKNNKEYVLTKKREWTKRTIENNPIYNFSILVRRNISMSYKFGKKPLKTEAILGCTITEFRNYIESKFKEGMTFENHGRNGWHLDHIIPLSTAESEDEILKLCHYTNFQPLWEKDNLRKSNKLDYEFN
jgi:hypothetical protein